jgi:hypothetical protein
MDNSFDQLKDDSSRKITLEAIFKTISKPERSQTESVETLPLKDLQTKIDIWVAFRNFINSERHQATRDTLDPTRNLEIYQRAVCNNFSTLKNLEFVDCELLRKL